MARSKIVRARRIAHKTSVGLGHVRAIQTGRIAPRILNMVLGHAVAALLRGRWF